MNISIAKSDVCSSGEQMSALTTATQQLAHLNRRFLELAATDGHLSDSIQRELCWLSDGAAMAISECPFSLFTLAFDEPQRWLALSELPRVEIPMTATTQSDRLRREFVATTVFFVWHLLQSNPLSAKILFALDDRIASFLRGVPVATLLEYCTIAADWLQPRWSQHRRFWPDLVRHAGESGDSLHRTRLLGRQLLARESLAITPLSPGNSRRLLPAQANQRFSLQTRSKLTVGANASL